MSEIERLRRYQRYLNNHPVDELTRVMIKVQRAIEGENLLLSLEAVVAVIGGHLERSFEVTRACTSKEEEIDAVLEMIREMVLRRGPDVSVTDIRKK